jgi:hypothetical protein
MPAREFSGRLQMRLALPVREESTNHIEDEKTNPAAQPMACDVPSQPDNAQPDMGARIGPMDHTLLTDGCDWKHVVSKAVDP